MKLYFVSVGVLVGAMAATACGPGLSHRPPAATVTVTSAPLLNDMRLDRSDPWNSPQDLKLDTSDPWESAPAAPQATPVPETVAPTQPPPDGTPQHP